MAEQLDLIAGKYFDHAQEANVTFSRARSFFTCDINVHAGRGLTLRGEGEAADAHSAFDDAAEHIAKTASTLSPPGQRTCARHGATAPARKQRGNTCCARKRNPLPTGRRAEGTPTYATVIAESPAEINVLSVGEAVMRMDLADQQVLMFRNSATAELNVVYRRPDGNIGWIDPSASKLVAQSLRYKRAVIPGLDPGVHTPVGPGPPDSSPAMTTLWLILLRGGAILPGLLHVLASAARKCSSSGGRVWSAVCFGLRA